MTTRLVLRRARGRCPAEAGRTARAADASTYAGGTLCRAATRNPSASRRNSVPKLASQMRVAFASIASNTGSSSPGELRDDLQHLRGRGLLLQRLGQLARARLHLVEQPHVLDRDHRLVGEGGDELDLLIGEWAYRLALQDDHADGCSFAQQRNTQHGMKAANSHGFEKSVFGIGLHIHDMDRPCLQGQSGR